MVCYSVDSNSSFENVRTKWVPEIRRHVPEAPFVLIGTKTDLRNDKNLNDEVLQLKDGRNMAKRLGAQLYIECSALTGDGINSFIETAVRAVLNQSKTGGIKGKLTKMLKIHKRPKYDSSDDEQKVNETDTISNKNKNKWTPNWIKTMGIRGIKESKSKTKPSSDSSKNMKILKSNDEHPISAVHHSADDYHQSGDVDPVQRSSNILISNEREHGNVIPKDNVIPIHKERDFAMNINFSVFNDVGMNCQRARSVASDEASLDGGIISQCSSLRRLIEGLKVYDAMKDEPNSLLDFIANHYRIRMIDDFNHFVAEHEHQSDEIMAEIIADHDFKPCDVDHCAHSKRHFDEMQTVSPYPSKQSQIGGDDLSSSKLVAFHSSKYDALHFVLFHLFETGYRYQVPRRPQRDDDYNESHDEKVAQQELTAAVSAINTGRDRCRGTLGRFESESNNKFTLSVSLGTESQTEDGNSVKTTTDSLMEYAESNGVGHDALVQINGFMVREDIDTDAAKDDVADSKEESNLFAVTKNHDAFIAVKRYFTLSAGW